MIGHVRRAAADAPGDRVRELGAVDDDERAGLGRDGGCGGAEWMRRRIVGRRAEDGADPHHRHVLHRELRHQPLLRHQRAADAEIADAAAAVLR